MYKYHLDPSSRKYTCPQCGHRTLVIYHDNEGRPIDMTVGRCERINNCRYHLPPREYFKGAKPHPTSNNKYFMTRMEGLRSGSMPPPTHFTLPIGYVARTLHAYDRNKLVAWLWDLFKRVLDRREFDRILLEYRVGTASRWGGSTVWWQIDPAGRMHTGKVMDYDPQSGHRVKEPDGRARTTWVHSLVPEGKHRDYIVVQCLFGAHLLSRYTSGRVWVLESEKGALIFALALAAVGLYGQIVPVATGGCGGLLVDPFTRIDPNSRIAPLHHRDVLLLPDDGMHVGWSEKVPLLEPFCRTVDINALACRTEGPADVECARCEGDGPDDIILRHLADLALDYRTTTWWHDLTTPSDG